jgi:hypothetical protein
MLLYNASATHTFAGITGLTGGTVAAWRTEPGSRRSPGLARPAPICYVEPSRQSTWYTEVKSISKPLRAARR